MEIELTRKHMKSDYIIGDMMIDPEQPHQQAPQGKGKKRGGDYRNKSLTKPSFFGKLTKA